MRLLNIKATLLTTLSAIIMVSSVYADIGLENKVKPLIDIKSVHDSKMKAEPIELPENINNFDLESAIQKGIISFILLSLSMGFLALPFIDGGITALIATIAAFLAKGNKK